jgi:hypothetical protein
MKYFLDDDACGDPTLWLANSNPPIALLRKSVLSPPAQAVLWPVLVAQAVER